MLRVLPIVNREACFALKGGTAINFFVRDMPRLSVDIDLTYLPLQDRETSLAGISTALANIKKGIQKALPQARVQEAAARGGNPRISKLVVTQDGVQVKIEPNEVLRGTVYGISDLKTSKAVEKLFETSVTVRCVSSADLYGGKLCAMLDRQHPRDMFDVKELMENGGITPEIRKAFVVYLAGHSRPMDELLSPNLKDMETVFEREFIGMTTVPVPYKELAAARKKCVANLQSDLDKKERAFLLSIMNAAPAWDLLGIPSLDRLPALQWKIQNVLKMTPKKRREAVERLERI